MKNENGIVPTIQAIEAVVNFIVIVADVLPRVICTPAISRYPRPAGPFHATPVHSRRKPQVAIISLTELGNVS